jgi:putative glutamine amidotransferase
MIFGYPASYTVYQDVVHMEYMLGCVGRPIHKLADLDGISLLILFGGEDISTKWYGERPVTAHAPYAPRIREIEEADMVGACLAKDVPVLGICRGAQFLCAYLGGKVWQHVDGHAVGERGHKIVFKGKTYKTNSYHHQMMRPTPEMEVLAYSEEVQSPFKWCETEVETEEPEAEIVYHPSKKVLMIQGHPEWVAEDHDLFKITRQLVKELLCH